MNNNADKLGFKCIFTTLKAGFLHINNQLVSTMATCKYCGQSSGLFSSSHKECEGKHTAGVGELRQMLARYFQHLTTPADIQQRLQALRKENYLNADDIATEATTAIDNYTIAIHRPFNMDVVQNVVHLVSALAEPYRVIDRNGAVTRFAHENNIPFAWHPRYHDHIIRHQDEMNRIAKYIEQNPLRWGMDCFYN